MPRIQDSALFRPASVLSYERHFLTVKAGLSRVLVELSLNARWATETAFFFPCSSFVSNQELLYFFPMEALGAIAHERP
jgi:hypothetical protein